MKHPSFLSTALFGLGVSVFGAILFHLLSLLFSSDLVVRCLIAGASLIYIVWLIQQSGERVGLVTTVTVWALMSSALIWTELSLVYSLLVYIVFIWLVRSLYFYSSLLSSLVDMGLSFLSFSAALWAAAHTGNVFLSFWCFFLVQALCSAVPAHFKGRDSGYPGAGPVLDDRFQAAYRTAEAALSKLSSIH
jgi:hypothetical protein